MFLREKLVDLALMIVAAEEGGRRAVVREVYRGGTEAREPVVVARSNLRIPSRVIEINGSGRLDEINIVCDGDFKVRISSGNSVVIEDAWSSLSAYSQYVDWLSAVEDNGKKVLVVRNVEFSNGLSITVDRVDGGGTRVLYVLAKGYRLK